MTSLTTAIERAGKEFDKDFVYRKDMDGSKAEDIKSFLSQKLISLALAFHESEIERLEGMKKGVRPVGGGVPVETYGYEEIYNQALSDSIIHHRSAIEEIKKLQK